MTRQFEPRAECGKTTDSVARLSHLEARYSWTIARQA